MYSAKSSGNKKSVITIQAVLKPFIPSSSLCQRIRPGHEFWHVKTTTIQCLWINDYPFSFTNRHTDRRIHNRIRFWYSFCHKFPCADEQLNVLNGCFFWRFCDVFVDTFHNAKPLNCSVFYQWFDHDINAITSFVRIEFHIQDCADLHIWTNPLSRSGCCEVDCTLDMLSA